MQGLKKVTVLSLFYCNLIVNAPVKNYELSTKVLLRTTVGDIDIELWSKETPKTCRNFVQLCLEGYYDGTCFHRLIKGFIVQGGDPNGDGTGGESIYGSPFKDEFHSRLRFVRRGLVAMANSGKDDNGSQFFFTLGPCTELQNKNTIFGKVTGNTLYNMLKLEESLVDQDDRPLYPHKIISTEIISNPFPDIVPRTFESETIESIPEEPKEKGKKNFNLLSFGEEAEEDEAEIETVNEAFKGQSKSSHDLTNDPILSSVPAVKVNEGFSSDNNSDNVVLEKIRKKLEKANEDKKLAEETEMSNKIPEKDENDESLNKRKEIKKQIKELKKELSRKKEKNIDSSTEDTAVEEQKKEEEENSILSQYHKQLQKYNDKSKMVFRKGTTEREEQTLKFLKKFESNLQAKKQIIKEDLKSASEDDDDNETWLVHCLRAEDQKIVLAKDANMPSTDRYDLSDPRNPLNERRRQHKKMKK